jgi:hypothetical protein
VSCPPTIDTPTANSPKIAAIRTTSPSNLILSFARATVKSGSSLLRLTESWLRWGTVEIHATIITSIAVALLVTSLIRLPVFVPIEVLLGGLPAIHVVSLALEDALLVGLVSRIILTSATASTDTHSHPYSQNPDTVSHIWFHPFVSLKKHVHGRSEAVLRSKGIRSASKEN